MTTQTATAPQPRTSIMRTDAARKLLAFAGLLVLIIVYSILSPVFLTFNNMVAIILATAVNGVLALGVTFVIISGGIDLSVGTVMTLTAVMAGVIITQWGFPVWAGVLGAIATGAVAGITTGTMVAKMKIPPFIATLGMFYVAKGLALVISGLRPIYFVDTPIFQKIAMGSAIGELLPMMPVPNAVLILFGAAIIAWIILSKTVMGRYTFALGSNEEATRLSGVTVDKWKMLVYMLSGMFAGVGGVIMASRLNSAQPALGAGYELDAIAAVVIGGTSLSGGEGSILGTIIGAFVISVLTNGLRLLSVPQEWQMVVTGAIVVFAVYLDVLRRNRLK